MLEELQLVTFLQEAIPPGREPIDRSMMSLVLVLMRLCEPSSELCIVEDLYERSPLADLLRMISEQSVSTSPL